MRAFIDAAIYDGTIMSLLVQKFGGTSVGSVERIEAVADKLAKFHAEGHQLVVVLSAMSGTSRLMIVPS